MAKVILSNKRKKRIEHGHPWVYRSEVENVVGAVEPGDIVDVHNASDYFLGRGYINPQSQMIVRLLTTKQDEEINYEFFKQRILEAKQYRDKLLPGVNSLRVVFGEADFLPGLTVDKYEDVLVVQIVTLGMDLRKEWIKQALIDVYNPRAIYVRNDLKVRELEGLEQEKGFIYGESETDIQIEENGVKYVVDIKDGQKTGFFFDQRQNRAAIKQLIDSESTVLDCFTHTGSFMLNACLYGAKRVTAVDISEHAVETARRNAALNGWEERVDFVCANAFDYLRDEVKKGTKFDVVIIDPPAFAKTAGAVKKAVTGYKDVNISGLKLVKEGGFFVTASCSYHVHGDLFREVVEAAAHDAKKTLRQIHWSGAGIDHPKRIGAEEGDYLKFAIYEVRSR